MTIKIIGCEAKLWWETFLYWRGRFIDWCFNLVTPDPGIRLPKAVIPSDDDEECST